MSSSVDELRSYVASLAPSVVTKKIPVYSVLIGDYDVPSRPKGSDVFSFYLFTDQIDIAENLGWKLIYLPLIDAPPLVLARAIKSLCHLLFPCHPKVFYVDASFMFMREFDDFFDDFDFNEFIAFQHPDRISVKAEIDACINARKEQESNRNKIANALKVDDNIKNSPALLASGFLGRNTTNAQVCKCMDKWFDSIYKVSLRDQLSLPFALQNCEVRVDVVPLNVYTNSYLVPRPHRSVSFLFMIKWKLGILLRSFSVLKKNLDCW